MAHRPVVNDTQWTSHDAALWRTCEIADQLLHGETPTVSETYAPFPTPSPDDHFWAMGPFQLLEFKAPGDGSYATNDDFFFATGGIGIALTAATMAARSIGNRSRRRQAEINAQPRWMPIAQGDVYLAPSSFTMSPGINVWTWHYSALTSAEMVAPQHLRFTGGSDNGRTINWVLYSDWAELAFVTWAVRHHPHHPQLQNSNWLPAGWLNRAQQLGSAPKTR